MSSCGRALGTGSRDLFLALARISSQRPLQSPCAILSLIVVIGLPGRIQAQVVCATDTIANDSTYATTQGGPLYGDAVGQVFYTPNDTLISSVTVWRPGTYISGVGAHLFIFGTDHNGRPNTNDLILDGPTVTVVGPAESGHLIVMSFVFDPPIALPHSGRQYAIMFQAANCFLGEPWRLMIDENNHYPYGVFWDSNRSTGPGCPIYDPLGYYYADLCFSITFCTSAATPTLKRSWGRLKLLYR